MIANARVGGAHVAHPTREVGFYDDTLTTVALPTPSVGIGTDENVTARAIEAPRLRVFLPARPAQHQLAYTLRRDPWPLRFRMPWNDGTHGYVKRNRPGSFNSRQREFYRSPRLLRSAPAVPWDAGTAVGATGERGD